MRRDLGGTVITPRWQPRSCFTGSCAAEGLRAGHNGWGRPLTSSNPRRKERACLVPYPGSSRRQRLSSERTCVRCGRTRLVGRATTTSHPATGCAGERKRRAPAGQHQTQYTLARAIFENPQSALFGRPEQVGAPRQKRRRLRDHVYQHHASLSILQQHPIRLRSSLIIRDEFWIRTCPRCSASR